VDAGQRRANEALGYGCYGFRVSLHPPHRRCYLEPYRRHIPELALRCALGARQGYVLRSVAMNGDKVPSGASDIIGRCS
jgi:hypothetical protein